MTSSTVDNKWMEYTLYDGPETEGWIAYWHRRFIDINKHVVSLKNGNGQIYIGISSSVFVTETDKQDTKKTSVKYDNDTDFFSIERAINLFPLPIAPKASDGYHMIEQLQDYIVALYRLGIGVRPIKDNKYEYVFIKGDFELKVHLSVIFREGIYSIIKSMALLPSSSFAYVPSSTDEMMPKKEDLRVFIDKNWVNLVSEWIDKKEKDKK